MENASSILRRIKKLIIGGSRNVQDSSIFHRLSLIALFAWVGLGADGLSSSCYGPPEAFINLSKYHYLGFFVALGTAFTIWVISTSYSQTIELFPSGGGGYLVASKLHSPVVGMISGCALLIDYILTISLSIASGADALFSFFPISWQVYKLEVAILGVLILIILNLRGVKESVMTLAPIFLTFVLTHLFVIIYASITHLSNLSQVAQNTITDVNIARSELGFFGMILLILRAYSMGAGTYTGIEAVSNGLPILREPRVRTGKRTMRLMATSLAIMAFGLMTAYFLYHIEPQNGKTINAVLFERIVFNWGDIGKLFVLIILISEVAILFVAAQTGFIDGPRILANMALDRWMPNRFSLLSDRLVTKNGIILMGIASLIVLIGANGRVDFLIILYSINVFITFILTESGMVRHWWQERRQERHWKRKLAVNGISLVLDSFILITVVITKFFQGGWITIVVTGSLVGVMFLIKHHYNNTRKLLNRLDELGLAAAVDEVETPAEIITDIKEEKVDFNAATAVFLVNGYNGIGLHTLFGAFKLFGNTTFKNYVFVQVGVVDAGNFKGASEVEKLRTITQSELERYVDFMHKQGYYSEYFYSIGTDIIEEITQLLPKVIEKYPKAIFFGGQLVFPEDTYFTRWLHNYIVFVLQKKLYQQGMPLIIMPIKVY